LKKDFDMFKVPEGATVWVLGDSCPILKLKDGSTVLANEPDVPISPATFARAEPVVKGDFDFWEKIYRGSGKS
jgi:hypothetical protein